jgi:hypothetical protein
MEGSPKVLFRNIILSVRVIMLRADCVCADGVLSVVEGSKGADLMRNLHTSCMTLNLKYS